MLRPWWPSQAGPGDVTQTVAGGTTCAPRLPRLRGLLWRDGRRLPCRPSADERQGRGPQGAGGLASSRPRGPGLGNFRFECPVSLFPHLRGCFLFSGIYVEIPAREPRALGRLALAGAVGGSRGPLHLGAMAKNTVVTGPATLEHAPPDGPGGWLRVRLSAQAAGGGCGSAPGPAGSRVSGL